LVDGADLAEAAPLVVEPSNHRIRFGPAAPQGPKGVGLRMSPEPLPLRANDLGASRTDKHSRDIVDHWVDLVAARSAVLQQALRARGVKGSKLELAVAHRTPQ
jgi:hypothetical protein